MTRGKLSVGVFFGGNSGEHEVSIESAVSVINHLNREKYEVIPLYLKKDNSIGDSKSILERKVVVSGVSFADIKIEKSSSGSLVKLLYLKNGKWKNFDFFFPVLHGPYGEDGKIQGFFEMSGVPYAGCGVGGSAVGMDKVLMKKIFQAVGIPTVKFLYYEKRYFLNNERDVLEEIDKFLSYPVFVKPSRMGSSVGITKVKSKEGLRDAFFEAFKYDYKVLVEEGVGNAREIECSVLGNFKVDASFPGEIVPAKEFYDYEAKYGGLDSKLIIPAKLEDEMVENIRKLAIKAFKSIDGKGFARVDFLLGRDGKLFLNEINTIPGFTKISMFPKLWEYSGISYENLLDRVIELGFEIFKEKNL